MQNGATHLRDSIPKGAAYVSDKASNFKRDFISNRRQNYDNFKNFGSDATRKSYNAFAHFPRNQKKRYTNFKNNFKGRIKSELTKTIKTRANDLLNVVENVRKLGKHVQAMTYDVKFYNKAVNKGDNSLVTKYKSRIHSDKKNIQKILNNLPSPFQNEMTQLLHAKASEFSTAHNLLSNDNDNFIPTPSPRRTSPSTTTNEDINSIVNNPLHHNSTPFRNNPFNDASDDVI